MLGLDPDPQALWPVALEGGDAHNASHAADTPTGLGPGSPAGLDPGSSPQQRAGRALWSHCRALIDATAHACVATKLQLARFEALGSPGWAALERVAAHARERGLLVIADGKRGDIDVTAQAYASALLDGIETPFGRFDGLAADLVTVNPLMGADAVEPFVAAARRVGAGVLVLVRTSNPGAGDVEDLRLAPSSASGGQTGTEAVWERIAAIVATLGGPGRGDSGLSDVGAVVGATAPGHLARARELMPAAPFLLPGVGAQGGRVEDLAPAFAPGPAGGLVSASRSIANAHRAHGGDPAAAARAEAERLREAAWQLSQFR